MILIFICKIVYLKKKYMVWNVHFNNVGYIPTERGFNMFSLNKSDNNICPECFKEIQRPYVEIKRGEKYCLRCYADLIKGLLDIDFNDENIFTVQNKLHKELRIANKEELKQDYQKIKNMEVN